MNEAWKDIKADAERNAVEKWYSAKEFAWLLVPRRSRKWVLRQWRAGQIVGLCPVPGCRPVFSQAELDRLNGTGGVR
jgi:hypothetical protein